MCLGRGWWLMVGWLVWPASLRWVVWAASGAPLVAVCGCWRCRAVAQDDMVSWSAAARRRRVARWRRCGGGRGW
jgi:hypothetical protein